MLVSFRWTILIKSVGELGLREDSDSASYREVIGSILEEAGRLARLVDILLTLMPSIAIAGNRKNHEKELKR